MCISDRYIPGKQNIAADVLSRINLQNQTFDGEKEQIAKVYHIIKSRKDLRNILKDVKAQQEACLLYTSSNVWQNITGDNVS